MLENSVVKHKRAQRALLQQCHRQTAEEDRTYKWYIAIKKVESA